MATDHFNQIAEAAGFLGAQVPITLQKPSLGIICGSGLGDLANTVKAHSYYEVPYASIPHFPSSSVHGHPGKLIFGMLGNHGGSVVFMLLRGLFNPDHNLPLIGNDLLVTNAAGGLDPTYSVGDIVVLNDHLNLAGLAGIHPLQGPNLDNFGVRFPALSDAYDLNLRRLAHNLWNSLQDKAKGRQLHEGIYAFVSGPSYETRAECRALRRLGADLVGMSTVPEVIVARHCNMRVLAISLVTNNAIQEPGLRGDDQQIQELSQEALSQALEMGKASHDEVLKTAGEAAKDLQRLVDALVLALKAA